MCFYRNFAVGSKYVIYFSISTVLYYDKATGHSQNLGVGTIEGQPEL